MKRVAVDIREIRELAKKFTPEELDICIFQQIEDGSNLCNLSGPTEYVVSELAKASYVREEMDKGVALTDAIRDLAGKIRQFQKKTEE